MRKKENIDQVSLHLIHPSKHDPQECLESYPKLSFFSSLSLSFSLPVSLLACVCIFLLILLV